MTKVYKYEEFKSNAGQTLFIEQYAEKPHFTKFWRYGVVLDDGIERFCHVYSKMLLSKPNKKRLIETY